MRYKNAKWKNQSKKKARMEYQYLFSIFIKKNTMNFGNLSGKTALIISNANK